MFQLTKVWVDPSPGYEIVEIRYTWSPLGEPGKFDGEEDTEVMAPVPNTNPRVRQAILEIPRYLKNKDTYSFHYQFIPGGTVKAPISPIFTEEIVAKEVAYVDTEGWATEVRLLWSVDGWGAPNLTQATLEGLSLNIGGDLPGHDREGEGIADEAIYELVQTVPLPRRYLAKVWGPKGSTVEYVFQLLRSNAPTMGDEGERWDNNNEENYKLTL
ncbi:MAG TPA: hypothetical protein VKG79_04090 [Bryobacteraceae bacterium]|nr:hypothetical protein [Bryobacteraceae bacterium]